jgi:DNA/RNA-binding domain of Phe-tRNA-synthetase-like protein
MLNASPDLLSLGLSTAVILARGVSNSPTLPVLADYRGAVGRRLSEHWKNRSLSSDPVLHEYERIHSLCGVADERSAPEKLLRYVRRHQDFTAASAVVDCYNLVSARTLLSIGAHDLAKLKTPITLRPVMSTDVSVPLGEREPKSCRGDYAYVDPDGRSIGRMEVLHVDIEDFARLDLRAGTVFEIRALASLPHLTAITVQIDERVDALAPMSRAAGVSAGAQVIIATKLHSLTVCDSRFTALLLAPISSEIAVPNGSRVS